MASKKWYVVWKGIEPGIYDNWLDAKRQIDGFDGALYKSFPSQENAKEAYNEGPWSYIGKNRPKPIRSADIIQKSISVDAACSGNPGIMEYRGVWTETGEVIFHKGPFHHATNNIGEFLALVHVLALLKKQNLNLPVYSDSVNAMIWVEKKKCKTKLEQTPGNEKLFELIHRAETWLQNNTFSTKILKWDTKAWGEIPADFGRK